MRCIKPILKESINPKPIKPKRSIIKKLIADGIIEDKKSSKPTTKSEHWEQIQMVKWLTDYPRKYLVTATANGVVTSPQQRSKLAASGVSRGVPDLLSFTPVGKYVGIAIEMKKATGGRASPEQKKWINDLKECGWLAIIAKGYQDGIKQITEALKEDHLVEINPWSIK
jgi:hypothetical protein